MDQERSLDISWGTVLRISLAVVSFYILFQIENILVWFVFALIISILVTPAVNFLRRLKLPTVLAVTFVYVGIFGLLILLVYFTLPVFLSEIQQFSQLLPQYFQTISPLLRGLGIKAFEDIDTLTKTLGGTLEKISSNIFNILFSIFGGIFASVFILTTAIFISLEEKWVEKTLALFFPQRYDGYIASLFKRCQKRVSGWFTTRVLSCLFVGVCTYIALLIFKTSYPFSLGLIAGVLNFVPVVGPIITGIALFITASLGSFLKAIFVLAVFTLIQQIEGSILIPIISKKLVGVSPVLVLLSLAIGGVLWGFLGAILAVPLAGILVEFLKDFLKKRREAEAEAEAEVEVL